jgi:CopG family transcriptional regulator / antitoxin EndoAI
VYPEITETAAKMHRRINITLPEETVRLIDRVSEKGDRSRLIDKAVKLYVADARRASLRKRLKEGALRRADRDLGLAEESFFLEEEAWLTNAR